LVERKLRIVPGVADVAALGGRSKEFQAEINLDRMRAYGLTLPQIVNAISTSNSPTSRKFRSAICRGSASRAAMTRPI
jgi:Cu/Ag efflux pump CusA